MDLMKEVKELIVIARDFSAAFQAGDIPTMIAKGSEGAAKIAAIIIYISQGLHQRTMAGPNASMQGAFANANSLTADELADELEDCCKNHGLQAVGGPFIDTLLPILLALLKKLLGF